MATIRSSRTPSGRLLFGFLHIRGPHYIRTSSGTPIGCRQPNSSNAALAGRYIDQQKDIITHRVFFLRHKLAALRKSSRTGRGNMMIGINCIGTYVCMGITTWSAFSRPVIAFLLWPQFELALIPPPRSIRAALPSFRYRKEKCLSAMVPTSRKGWLWVSKRECPLAEECTVAS